MMNEINEMVMEDCFAYRADVNNCGALNKLYCECEECKFYKTKDEVDRTTMRLINNTIL